jgi:hypothetical protein
VAHPGRPRRAVTAGASGSRYRGLAPAACRGTGSGAGQKPGGGGAPTAARHLRPQRSIACQRRMVSNDEPRRRPHSLSMSASAPSGKTPQQRNGAPAAETSK